MDNKLPFRHLTRWLLIGTGALLVLTLVVVHLVPAPKLIIAPDTTVITSPLNADGTPNYVEYLDALHGEGVTAYNNAAPLLVRALGMNAIYVINPSFTEPLCARLGLTLEEVERGPHIDLQIWQSLIDAGEIPRSVFGMRGSASIELGRIHDITEVIRAREPVRQQLATWLKEIEPALELVRQASLKDRLYCPAIAEDSDISSVHMLSERISNALEARAWLHIVNGETAEAWHDTLTLYRLADLFGKSSKYWSDGISFSEPATNFTIFLAEHGQLPPQRLRGFLLQMQQVPEIAINEQALDKAARFNCLAELIDIARVDDGLPPVLDFYPSSSILDIDLRFTLFPWDVNEALRHINKHWDQRVAAMRLADYASRHAALVALEDELEREVSEAFDRSNSYHVTLWAMGAITHAERGRFVGAAHLLFSKDEYIWQYYNDLITQAAARHRLSMLALALAIHKAEQGTYPEKLHELAPGILEDGVPLDPFSEKEFIYERTADGFLLYSSGQNSIDDGANDDDIVVRVPTKSSPADGVSAP